MSLNGTEVPPQGMAVARVAVKAPPFWRANPEIWFHQMESQFTLAGISAEETKFHHVVSALQPEELQVVGDIIRQPPADPYSELKKRLCNLYADTEEQRLRQLISGIQLGDRRPSRLLLEMRSTAGTRLSDDLLKTLFLQRLPTQVQQILAISNDKLDKLAEMADGILAVSGNSAVQSVCQASAEDPIKDMLLEISSRLDRLETRSGARSRSRSRARENRRPFRQRSTSGNRTNHDQGFCWFHRRFGADARNCKQPCSFQPGN